MRNMLCKRYEEALPDLVLGTESINLIDDRVDAIPWSDRPKDIRKALIERGEEYLGYQWPDLPATAYLSFSRTGNREEYELPSLARRIALSDLTLAEAAEGKGRFIDDLINGVWAVCEESTWVVPAHNYIRLGVFPSKLADPGHEHIDLFSGDSASLLAWIHRLLKMSFDQVEPLICRRINDEVHTRVIDPYINSDELWWMWYRQTKGHHVNNWTPWCLSNCLTATHILESHPERRLIAVRKALRILDVFLNHYTDDGGCDEGPSYWERAAGSLLDCLDVLYCLSRGKIDIFSEAKIRNMGRYLCRVHVGGATFVNFADSPARILHDWSVLERYARRTQNEDLSLLAGIVQSNDRDSSNSSSLERRIRQIYLPDAGFEKVPSVYTHETHVWFEGIQVMVAREEKSEEKGFLLAAKGGHNDESHNHNDVGHFAVYYDTHPILIDPGVPTYSSATFDPKRRYTLWPMQSTFHNLPVIGSHEQGAGREFCAKQVECAALVDKSVFTAQLSDAYPTDAGVASFIRRVELNREGIASVVWTDTFALERQSSIQEVLMFQQRPIFSDRAFTIVLPDGKRLILKLPIDVDTTVEAVALDDKRLKTVWGDTLYRILIEPTDPILEASLCFALYVEV